MENQLIAAMVMIVDVFNKHAAKDGDKLTLSKGEVKDLLKSQFGGMLGVSDLCSFSISVLHNQQDARCLTVCVLCCFVRREVVNALDTIPRHALKLTAGLTSGKKQYNCRL